MSTPLRLICGLAFVAVAGFVLGELLCCSRGLRNLAGVAVGRGRMVAIAHGIGFYEVDVEDETASARDLVMAENLRRVALREVIDLGRIDRELDLLRAEFGKEEVFAAALRASKLSLPSLRARMAAELRSRQWLEKQLSDEARVSEAECRSFYEKHRDLFLQPVRFRASHLFLAAHAETPAEIVAAKEDVMNALAARLAHGGIFGELVAQNSEDEATKSHGGDLNFFSPERVPPEFYAEVAKLPRGQMSQPFQSHLGFHIIQVTEVKPPTLLSFEQAQPEIALTLANARRESAMERIASKLAQSAQELRDCVSARLP